MADNKKGGFFSFLLKDKIVARPGFNRWWVPPASISIHLCIGSVYAWSVFNPALTRELGVVVSAAGDWSLGSVVWIFSVAIVCLGLAAAVAGRWLEDVGPRCVGVTAAFLWGGGVLSWIPRNNISPALAGIFWIWGSWWMWLRVGLCLACFNSDSMVSR